MSPSVSKDHTLFSFSQQRRTMKLGSIPICVALAAVQYSKGVEVFGNVRGAVDAVIVERQLGMMKMMGKGGGKSDGKAKGKGDTKSKGKGKGKRGSKSNGKGKDKGSSKSVGKGKGKGSPTHGKHEFHIEQWQLCLYVVDLIIDVCLSEIASEPSHEPTHQPTHEPTHEPTHQPTHGKKYWDARCMTSHTVIITLLNALLLFVFVSN